MNELVLKHLTEKEFRKFGAYADLLHPEDFERVGEGLGGFYRDMIQIPLGTCTSLSASVSQVHPLPFQVSALECHDRTAEGMLPLDNDIVLCLAPATFEPEIPLSRIEAFYIPKGTLVMIHPGVWHAAALPCGGKPVNMLVMLPERTYVNDFTLRTISKPIVITEIP